METQAHGTLIGVLGVGVLLLGRSGIGKSECALELVGRGHALVADDAVRLVRRQGTGGADAIWGHAPEVVRHYMEIRGIGLLFVPDLYGPRAVADEARVDLICRLEEWREGAQVERIGLERPSESLLGVPLPALRLQTRPAGSMATLVEVAARDHLARQRGASAARQLDDGLLRRRAARADPTDVARERR